MYYTYMVRCNDGTLYTGYTTNMERRLFEHNESTKGAKYTRARRPVKLIYFEEFPTHSEACKREAQIKKMKRHEKEQLINKYQNDKTVEKNSY